MWRSIWRSIDRFSLHHLRHVIDELQQVKVVDNRNKDLVIDLLQSIVEIVTYGDRKNPMIFECFMECQVLAEFVRILKISRTTKIEAPLLQYLSIMIQNMENEHAIYYCLSNDYINNIIIHKYDFDGGDLAPYYMSFLRAVSSKVSRDTLCLLVKVEGDVVTSFPLYYEALKFAQHREKMIQTAVRALTLNIYNVSDDTIYQFVTMPPVSNYFSDLVINLKKKCIYLDGLVRAIEEPCSDRRRKDILMENDKILDDLYYFKDILSVGNYQLSKVVTHNLITLLVFPLLFRLLQLKQSNDFHLSAITSMYIVSHLVQVVGGKDIVNSVVAALLFPYETISPLDACGEKAISEISREHVVLVDRLNEMELLEVLKNFALDFGEKAGTDRKSTSEHLEKTLSLDSHGDGCKYTQSHGILSYVCSDNPGVTLISLFLLLSLVENRDLDCFLASMIEFSEMQYTMILNALLRVLTSQPPFCALIEWHTGWFLAKFLSHQGKNLRDDSLILFNNSYLKCCECLREELDGCWFDHILDAFRDEWSSCKGALTEPLESKSPLFALELAICQQKYDERPASSDFAWQRMVDVVKVFILHLQLKDIIFKGELFENPLIESMMDAASDSGKSPSLDISSAFFGSEVFLGSGIPCRIAFSKAGIRDIYLIPTTRRSIGKLILAEKHPFRSQRGIVIAIAPLAGLNPKIDEHHKTWLLLRIREFNPKSFASNKRGHNPSTSTNSTTDGKWILGFPSAEACEAACLLIQEEVRKQRSFVEKILAPLLESNYPGDCQFDKLDESLSSGLQ